MSADVVALVLGSALLHASWNAALRSGVDRLYAIMVMTLFGAVVSLPVALALPAPARAAWPYLATSALLQCAYCVALVRAYKTGELGAVYPIARGSSPALVALGALVFADERLPFVGVAGVALVVGGIFVVARARGPDARPLDGASLAAALATGALIASYTLVDGVGARASGHAPSYAAWLFVCQGAPLPLLYLLLRDRASTTRPSLRETAKAAAGGVVSLVAYGLAVWAMTRAPMGGVSALRECSVLFAVLLGRVVLGERSTIARVAGCVAIAVGAVLLAAT